MPDVGRHDAFLSSRRPRPWRADNAPPGITPVALYLSDQAVQVEVAYAEAASRPKMADLRKLWSDRWAHRPSAVLLVVTWDTPQGRLAGLVGLRDEPSVAVVLLPVVDRAVDKALAATTASAAEAVLGDLLVEHDPDAVPGLNNAGLFATYELLHNVPQRPDWGSAARSAAGVRGHTGRDVLSGLGWTLDTEGTDYLLGSDGKHEAVAVVLEGDDVFDRSSSAYHGSTPVEHALGVAHRHNVRWVLVVKGTLVRLYTADPDTGIARKGTASYTEVDLTLLPDDRLGYVGLLLTPTALRDHGTVTEILASSADHGADLGARLRERVYNDVIPGLATTVAQKLRDVTDSGLERAYHVTLVILFRLLFVAYAEDGDLLPYRTNDAYRSKALKSRARRYAVHVAEHGRTPFDHASVELWHDLQDIWRGIYIGASEWSIPAYGGSLFDPQDEIGKLIAGLTLTNAEIGPAVERMLVDTGPDGTQGPVDFQTLSVREFGTIYEGLLESSLSLAPVDLALDRNKAYVPAKRGDEVVAPAGSVYFHNSSGVRKATGSYFTKQFAVEHLLRSALDPSVEEHLARVTALLEAGKEADAAERLFDFRVADLAMGSGHFLVAAVDHVGTRFAAFLDEHPIPYVTAELDGLRATAVRMLEQVGVHEIPQMPQMGLVRRQVARRCIYGIDLNTIAVDLARLAVWIHTFVPGLPMSTLDHGLVVGNSLTGIGTLDEAIEVLDPEGDGGQVSLFRQQIEDGMAAGAAPLKRLALLAESTVTESREAADLIDEATAAIEPTKHALDAAVAGRLGLIDLRHLGALGWDAVVEAGASAAVRTKVEELGALHFPVAFPEVFSRERPGFDVILGNPPWEEATIEENKFWAMFDSKLRSSNSPEQAERIRRLRRSRPDLYALFTRLQRALIPLREALVRGPYPGMGTGDPDLYKAFVWRFWTQIRSGGSIGVVLPRSVWATLGSAEWRTEALSHSQARLVFISNQSEWLFTDVNPGWQVSLTTITRSAKQPALTVTGTFNDYQQFEAGLDQTVSIPLEILRRSDSTMCIPSIDSADGLRLFRAVIQAPPLGGRRPDFSVLPATELHATNDGKKRLFTHDPADFPVYNHVNIDQFRFNDEPGAFNFVDYAKTIAFLQSKRAATYKRSDSPFRNQGSAWALKATTLPALNPRIAFRDVVHASNPRKMWAAVVPAETFLTNSAPYLVFSKGGHHEQACLLALLNSSTCDWYCHTRVVLHMNFFIFNSVPIPIITQSRRFARLRTLASQLVLRHIGVYQNWGDEGPELRSSEERDSAIAEIDAIATLEYGITRDLLPLIFDGRPTRPSLDAVHVWRKRWETS